ncbi:ribosome recycling factor [Salisaeta longa]|uniref:ribosome recycling factor n=1 Tax=Salisaeta longa TaxID=503170 RepID=UPI0003B2EB3B|nr:ribosome recycling factor [Salisaeta longa]
MADDPIQNLLDDAHTQMDETLEYLRSELKAFRVGRARPAMLENIRVDYYGSQTPLNQLATITAPQADLLLIQPFDKNAIQDIERAIMTSDLGLNPNNDGQQIRIPVPPLSEERRKEIAKTVRERAEDAKISIRNIRREFKDELKQTIAEENLSEDVLYGGEEDIQALTDEFTERIDQLMERKVEEIMQV